MNSRLVQALLVNAFFVRSGKIFFFRLLFDFRSAVGVVFIRGI